MRTIIHIIIKEILQLKRDKKLFGIVIVAPILQLIFLGYAANMDVNEIDALIYDQDKSVMSREYIDKIKSSGYFNINYYVNSYEEINELIDNRKAIIGIVIPKEFEKKIYRKETSSIQIILDGSDGNKASISFGYLTSITSSFSQNILLSQASVEGKLKSIGVIQPETRVWYNPDLKTRVYMVPSILGLIILIVTVALMSMAIVKEREIGTLEQLIVTPIKPLQLLLGKLIPYIFVAFISLSICLIFMVYWFNIEIRGSLIFLLFSSFIFLLSTLGLGLFASTISKTQQQAMMLAIFAFNMPMIYLSGFIFPIENMPQAIQLISYAIPLRYFLVILRGIVLKGIGIAELWQELLILFLLGSMLLTASAMRFKKRLE